MANFIHLDVAVKFEATLQSDPIATVKVVDSDEAPMHLVIIINFLTSIEYRF